MADDENGWWPRAEGSSWWMGLKTSEGFVEIKNHLHSSSGDWNNCEIRYLYLLNQTRGLLGLNSSHLMFLLWFCWFRLIFNEERRFWMRKNAEELPNSLRVTKLLWHCHIICENRTSSFICRRRRERGRKVLLIAIFAPCSPAEAQCCCHYN